jgi:hypothetical protein
MTYTLKTQKQKGGVQEFLANLPSDEQRKDAQKLVTLIRKATGTKPELWGNGMIGFGSYTYTTRSGSTGVWPMVGFAPRKKDLTVYIMPGFDTYEQLLATLGPHKHSVSCLYIKRLADIALVVLEKIIKDSYEEMRKKYE